MGIVAIEQSLALLLEVGIETIWKRVLERTELLYDLIAGNANLQAVSCNAPGRYAGITIFKHRNRPDQQVYENLAQQDILCAMRGGGIRFSPHFYTPVDSLATAIEIAGA